MFKSRFLRPTEAILVLIGIRTSYDVTQLPGTVGSTMVFQLTTAVSNVAPVTTIRSEAPCYEMQKIAVPVSFYVEFVYYYFIDVLYFLLLVKR